MPVLTYCHLEGKISTKYLAPIPTNILSLGMGISTLLGARGGQFRRSREKYMDCRNSIAARVQGAKIFFVPLTIHHLTNSALKKKFGCVYSNIFFGFAMPKKVKTFPIFSTPSKLILYQSKSFGGSIIF